MNMADEVPFWIYPLAGFALLAAGIAAGVTVYLRRRAQRRNIELIERIAYDVLRNVLVPNGNGGQLHVNYLLLTERGLLVVDLFDVPGAIFGGDQMLQWTSIGRKRRFTFSNPQHLLYDRMAAVKLLASEVPVDGRLVFTTRGDFPKGKPKYVVRIDQLASQFPVVDRLRGNVAAAFNDVWQNVKRNVQPNSGG